MIIKIHRLGTINICSIHLADVEIFHWISEHFDLLLLLDENLRHHSSHDDSSSGNNAHLFIISWPSIQILLRYFSLDKCD